MTSTCSSGTSPTGVKGQYKTVHLTSDPPPAPSARCWVSGVLDTGSCRQCPTTSVSRNFQALRGLQPLGQAGHTPSPLLHPAVLMPLRLAGSWDRER